MKVIAIDNVPARLRLAEQAGAITIQDGDDVLEHLKALTGGRGPDCCTDTVGLKAHGSGCARRSRSKVVLDPAA